MDFFTKLERKFGKFAIPNLTLIIILTFVMGYILEMVSPDVLAVISLNPEKVFQGEVFRLVTWLLIPPSALSVFTIITLMFYFYVGRTLENVMGDFKYTVYVVFGIIFTDLGVVLTYLVMKIFNIQSVFEGMYEIGYFGSSTYYLCLSLFLAYAFMFPDLEVLLYFIIPIKVKWLGYLDIAYLLFTILKFGLFGYYEGMVTVIMSVLNFIIFYLVVRKGKRPSASHMKRRRDYKKTVRQTTISTRHKCAICGQTEEDNPELEFRYCSRCKGNYEYCQNHLFTHEHKK